MTLLVEKVNKYHGRHRGDHLSHHIANKHRKATNSEEQQGSAACCLRRAFVLEQRVSSG